MKSIYQLVPDIQDYISRNENWYEETILGLHSCGVRHPYKGRLRLSGLGDKCPRQLWHSVHLPHLAEPLPPSALFKYSYGHILESMALTLAKLAGHDVTGEQDELVLDGVVGHRDAVIDGCTVDIKSCSSLQFQKFKNRLLEANDAFGYLFQLDAYVLASRDDPSVHVKDRGFILAIDKTLGHMILYEHLLRPSSIRQRIAEYKRICGLNSPPDCECGTEKDGLSGNIKLDVRASYSPYKYVCFPHLRTFIYANGPRYLTKVVRTPDVPEVRRYNFINEED